MSQNITATVDIRTEAIENAKRSYVRSWICFHQPVTEAEIVDGIGYDDETIYRILTAFETREDVIIGDDGKYRHIDVVDESNEETDE